MGTWCPYRSESQEGGSETLPREIKTMPRKRRGSWARVGPGEPQSGPERPARGRGSEGERGRYSIGTG